MKTFTCRLCGTTFEKETRSYAYYCDACRKIKSREASYKCAVKSGRIQCPGVGSGGNQLGEHNHQWSEYKAEYSYRHLIDLTECVFCHSTEHLVRHHIDMDRKNNSKDNLICLCRSCHAKVHKLVNNINSRNKTSLIQGNSRTDNPEPSHIVEGATTNPDECKDVGSSESKCEATEM